MSVKPPCSIEQLSQASDAVTHRKSPTNSDNEPFQQADDRKLQEKGKSTSMKGKMEPICAQQSLLSCEHASQLIEYQWPLSANGEYYLLQEQVSVYLNILSFKRKYPDIKRRKMEPEEINYLIANHSVNDAQVTLGLTAVRSCDVCEMMMKEYPDKFNEFNEIMQEREKQRLKNQYAEYANTNSLSVEKAQMPAFRQKIIKQVSKFNARLNKQRKEDFNAYYDEHTNVIQYPTNKMRKLDPNLTRPSLYPCALIPGQFQEYCKRYSRSELMYLPVKTSLYGPPPPPLSDCDVSDEEFDDGDTDDEIVSIGTDQLEKVEQVEEEKNLTPVCGICNKDETCNKYGEEEALIKCSSCDNYGHPSCLEMSEDVLEVMKTYNWECMECKVCTICSQPHREDLMMFCDRCDRGYHTFCVGLRTIPTGVWACSRCIHEDPKFKKRKTKELKLLNQATNKKGERQAKSKSVAKKEMAKRKMSAEISKKAERAAKNAVKIENEEDEEIVDTPRKVTNGRRGRRRGLNF